ncbi:AMP-binding protein [Luteimonas saliphila]|uniref:AMP-binding protein n=1 Tax=Luteimonas saliphila TaxID=2804919 RepID=UPI00192D9FAD|nr:AMP-binding protein [Luteimonas saliphila]
MSLVVSGYSPERLRALALADERVRLSWADLDPLLDRLANALLSLDLGEQRRVAVFAGNCAETVVAYAGCLLAGASSVPVNYHLTVDELVYILDDSGARVAFVGPDTLDVGLEAASRVGIGTVIGWRCPPTPGVIAWEAWLAASSAQPAPTGMKPLPHLHYTSGTTGTPKATETPPAYFPPAETVAGYVAKQRERSALLPQGPGVVAGPLYHTGPLTMVRALLGGCPLMTMDAFDPERLLKTIHDERIEATVMVPTHFQRLLALPDEVRARYDVSSMKRMAHTGAACPADVKRRMIEWFGPVLVEAYGGTEAGTTNMITSEEWLRRPGSVGRAVAPFEVVILSEDGSELGPNRTGQVYFRDATGRGIVYRNDPAKTAEAHVAPGVFTLGEVGHVDDEGYLYITDRVSDMIVSGGVNIYPAEVEQVLLQHPEVADAVVIGVPNKEMGEEVKALVVPRHADFPVAPEVLNQFCRQHLAGYKCPRSYEFHDDIGRNAMGKINKKSLKRRYWPTDRTIGG